MSANSKIAWTNHTINGWWGCEKIKPECQKCYAQTWAERTGYKHIWGKDAPRRPVKSWRKTIEDIAGVADAIQQRQRVFVGSMMDIGEEREDIRALSFELLELPEKYPGLDFQYLTKRPKNLHISANVVYGNNYPENAWFGVTCGHTASYDNVSALKDIPAAVRWLSIEPILCSLADIDLSGIDWVVVGGESGAGARPMEWAWVHRLKHLAKEAGAAFFFKQTGTVQARALKLKSKHGDDLDELPATLGWAKVREFPRAKELSNASN